MQSLVILVSVVLVLSCGQTESHAEADDRYTHTTTVGVSNNKLWALFRSDGEQPGRLILISRLKDLGLCIETL